MITLLALQFTAIFLFLAVRALMPELFVVSHRAPAAAHGRRRYRSSRPLFRCHQSDSTHSAGMGMMIH